MIKLKAKMKLAIVVSVKQGSSENDGRSELRLFPIAVTPTAVAPTTD